MKNTQANIVIVGGGPAGAYLGYLLAQQGIIPLIFDHSHPREKPCGGGISVCAIEKFPLLHQLPESKAPDNKMELISPSGVSVMISGEKSSWSLSRLTLDKYLLDQAIEKGCIHINEQVIDIQCERDLWVIKTKQGMYTSKHLIGADGVNSIVRKKILGPIPKEDIGICYGCFAVSKNKDEIGRIKFYKKKQGYAWCFPRNDHMSIGVGMGSASGNIKELFNDFIKEYYPDIDIHSTWGATIPNVKHEHFFSLPCAGENWLLVGDAAGHVDPMTGEGITYALWSAEVAAKAIMSNDWPSYDQLWRKEYGGILIESCKSRDFFYNPRILEYSIKIATRSKTFSTLLYKMMTNQLQQQNLFIRILQDLPKAFKEYIQSI